MLRFIVQIAILVSSVWAASHSDAKPLEEKTHVRIIGGDTVSIESYPFVASVQRSGEHICGGSIISPTWILSAAQCFPSSGVYSVRVGSTFNYLEGQVISVNSIFVHGSYNVLTPYDYDIAVLQLAMPITDITAKPISMAEGDSPIFGTTATVLGWGDVNEGGPSSTVLQATLVPVITQSICQLVYDASRVTTRMFCAGVLGVGGRDSCQGDAGGPLVTNGELSGIISWGQGCGEPNYPGVYTSVPRLRSWIRSVTGI